MVKPIVVFSCIFSFLCTLIPAAQITGTVTDIKKNTLAGVEVSVKQLPTKTITDGEGKFTLTVPDSLKNVVLVFNRNGYYSVERNVSVNDKPKMLKLFFIPQEYLLQKITVTAKNIETDELSVPMAETSVSGLEFQTKVPENVMEGLSDTPGVSFIGSGGYAITPSIRGLARRRVLVMVDGMRVSSDRRAGTSASFILPELVQRIEVIRSASSVLYGSDAIGGVINILTRTNSDTNRNTLNFSMDSINNKINSGLTYNYNAGKWSIASGFQTVHAGNYKAPGQTIYHSGYAYYSGLLNIAFQDDKREFSFGYTGGVGNDIGKPDRANNPTKYSIVPTESDHFIHFGLTEKSLIQKGSLDFSVFLNPAVYRLDKFDTKKNTLQHSDTEGSNLGMKATLKKSISRVFSYQAGLEWFSRQNIRMINMDRTGSKEVTTYPMTKGFFNDYGVFLSVDYSGIDTVNIDAGMRYNFFSSRALVESKPMEKEGHSPSFFLGVTKKITPSISLFGSIAKAFRFPSLSETFYSGITGRSSVIGNPLLKPESSMNLDAGLKMAFRRLSLGLYVFSYRIDNMIERYLNPQNVYSYDNLPKSTIYGGEVEFQYTPFRHLDLFGHYLYYRGRSITHDPVNDVPASRFFVGSKVLLNRFWFELDYLHSFKKTDPGPAELKNNAYDLLNVKGGYYLSSMFYVYMKLSNILNQSYYANADPDIPLAHGFEATAGIQLYF